MSTRPSPPLGLNSRGGLCALRGASGTHERGALLACARGKPVLINGRHRATMETVRGSRPTCVTRAFALAFLFGACCDRRVRLV
jgi:hypothetical protein